MTDTERERINAICKVAGVTEVDDLSDVFHTFGLMNDLISRQQTIDAADTARPYINQVKIGNDIGIIRDMVAHDEIAELREMIERLKGKPYYMKIQCHNCGAPLLIDSSDHLIKCRYCHTAYFSGTQLVNSGI